jgi:hypothetical protein
VRPRTEGTAFSLIGRPDCALWARMAHLGLAHKWVGASEWKGKLNEWIFMEFCVWGKGYFSAGSVGSLGEKTTGLDRSVDPTKILSSKWQMFSLFPSPLPLIPCICPIFLAKCRSLCFCLLFFKKIRQKTATKGFQSIFITVNLFYFQPIPR